MVAQNRDMFYIIPGAFYETNETGQWRNSSRNSSFGFCENFSYSTINYVYLSFSGIGLILNMLNMIAFVKMAKKYPKESMIKYLFVKSLLDFLYCVINISWFLFTYYSPYTYSYYYLVYYKYIDLYFNHVTMSLSIVFDCTAIIDRYLLISGRMKWMYKVIVFNRGIPILTIIAFALYSYKTIEFRILRFENVTLNNTSLKAYFQWTLDGAGLSIELSLILQVIQTTIVNFIVTSLILIFNILTLLEIKNKLRKKRMLTPVRNTIVHDRIKSAENRNTMMLVWSSPLIIIPNFAYFLGSMIVLTVYTQFYNACVDAVGNILYYSQFSFSFFFYYAFNVNFQKELSRKPNPGRNLQPDSTEIS